MAVRSVLAYRFPEATRQQLQQLDALLRGHERKPIGPLEQERCGFEPPLGAGSEELAVSTMGCVLVCLGLEQRILPAETIRREVETRRLKAVAAGETVGARRRRELKAQVVLDLLPKALLKHHRIEAWVDLEMATLFVAESSRKHGERVIRALREAMGTFPATPLHITRPPGSDFTRWVLDHRQVADGFRVGEEAELRFPGEHGAIVKVQRQEMDCDEMHEHIRAGKRCNRLALSYRDTASFVLDEELVMRKFKLAQCSTHDADQLEFPELGGSNDDDESTADTLLTDFILSATAVRTVATAIFQQFGVEAALPLFDQDSTPQQKAA